MERFMKKISIMLILCMFFSISGVEVFASDTVKDTSGQLQEDLGQIPEKSELQTSEDVSEEVREEAEQSTDSQIQETEENSVSIEAETAEGQQIEYLYLDKQILKKAEEQNVVVAFTDEQLQMESATLLYEAVGSQEQFESQADNIIDNTVLFAEAYEKFVIGESYRLLGVRYIAQGNVYETCFLENEAAEFEVTDQESDAAEVSEVVPEVTAYTMDDNGTIIEESGENVEEAVESVMDQAALPVVAAAGARTRTARDGELVVALDPGHDSHCGGAHANGLSEEVLTLKVANYCKEELEKYNGVKVIMTRYDASCPNPQPGSYNSAKDIRQRVQKAVAQGADVIVSFHFNSSGSSGANGAEVIYQNQSYNGAVGLESKELAQKIQDQLTALGLKNRGIYSKDSTDGSHDPNGVKDDYFALHNEAKALNTPAVLIEHAFLTGSVDAANLKSEAYLKKLGVADAQGIVNKYGLSKEAVIPTVSEVKVINQNEVNGTFQVQISGVSPVSNVAEVQVPIWSEENGQDDLIWYKAEYQGNGIYTVDVDVKKHKNVYGQYNIHVYITDRAGKTYPVSAITNMITKLELSVKLQSVDMQKGIFDVIITPLKSEKVIKEIKVPVWSKGDQSDLKWYVAEKQKDGTFKVRVDKKNHQNSTGIYNVHVYITTQNENTMSIIGGTIEVPMPDMLFEISDPTKKQTNISLRMANVGNAGNVLKVEFVVWSIENGQDDLRWYQGQQNASGIWEANINIADHKSSGQYYVDAYADLTDGSRKYLKTGTFNIEPITVGKVEFKDVDISNGIFDIIVKDISSVSGISSVRIPVWCDENQKDIKWYDAEKQNDGSYKVRVEKKNHQNTTGIYKVHVYVTGLNGITISVNGGTKTVEMPPMTFTAKDIDNTEQSFKLQINNVGAIGNISAVKFAVWSTVGGQDDLRWYDGSQNSSGLWETTVSIINHKTVGEYYVDAYGYDVSGSAYYLKTTSFRVSAPELQKVKFETVDEQNGIFNIIIEKPYSPAGVKEVRVPVWSKADQSDLVWYEAQKQNDGSYKVTADKKNHKNNTGIFISHIYITANNGITVSKLGGTYSIEQKGLNYTAKKVNEKEEQIELSISNVGYAGDIRKVKFAVWREGNTPQWYDAVQNSSGAWSYTVNISDHKLAGKYYADAYGYDANGQSKYLATETFQITDLKIGNVKTSDVDKTFGTFEITLSGVEAATDISEVKAAVWSENNKSDLTWLTGYQTGNANYKILFSPAKFNFKKATYKTEVVVVASNGIEKVINISEKTIPEVKPTAIMGESKVTAEQLVKLYQSSGAIYPTEVLTKGNAKDINEFCKIYIEEATAEGVKPEIAFAQAMLETGWLKFGGSVKIEQFNFCGLGATDVNGNVNSAWFKDVREGVRAQIQHLKAYASTDGLINPCVDPRFKYVTRGIAPYVETLGIKENPFGKGWATKAGYGYDILKLVNKIK